MELFENELILPGVITEIISDYASGYDTSLFGTTDSVVIVGTAFNGPVGKLVETYSPEHARYIFGDSYDSKTKREATLVANIQDAWNAGCRTIYAVRVSGENICKDYDLAIDTNLKLRLSGIFPSNSNKDISMFLSVTGSEIYANIYKPAARATISEKNYGLVESKDSILTNTINFSSAGLTLESSLTELINMINSYSFNNVLVLTIVDEKGNDVTLSSNEARKLKVKNLFSGLYTIGRDKTLGIPNTIVNVNANEDGELVKSLELNTDVSAAYPIFAGSKDVLSKYLKRPITSMFDFVTVPGEIDHIFEKDSTDYEQVDLTEFELYKKLGSGYAINAQIVEGKNGKYRVKEVEDSSDNKKAELRDGIYSMLENSNVKYRVLAGVSADAKIKNRLPKKEEFEEIVSQEGFAFKDALKIETVVGKEKAAKKFELEFIADRVEVPTDVAEKLIPSVAKVVSTLKPEDQGKKVDYKEGSLFLGDNSGSNQLFIVRNKVLVPLHESDDEAIDGNYVIENGQLFVCKTGVFVPATKEELGIAEDHGYITAMLENGSFVIAKLTPAISDILEIDTLTGEALTGEAAVGKTKKSTRTARTTPIVKAEIIGTASQVLKEEDEVILTSIVDSYGLNKIVISSPDFDVLTLEEAVDILNADPDFSKMFKLSVNNQKVSQEIMDDLITVEDLTRKVSFAADRKVIMNVNKYIPYRTDDNFARHLAQHCMYTSLKTAPVHGVIGTKVVLDTSLTSIANRVNELVGLNLQSTLVAKKTNGTDMLDRNNMQYPIGRKISVTFGQYVVTTDDGYSYISNMAAGYAGMVSQLPLTQSSTNQPISIPSPQVELTNYQLALLNKAGFVTTKRSYSNELVITDGITMASPDSPFKRLSATRIADGIDELIRSVSEPFLGMVNNLTNQNSLRSAIKSELEKIKSTLIEDYEFRIITDKASNTLGILNIEYAIIPLYEIRQIRNQITVKQ